jgi:hypothetical protein
MNADRREVIVVSRLRGERAAPGDLSENEIAAGVRQLGMILIVDRDRTQPPYGEGGR